MNDIEHAIVKNAFKSLISSILDVTGKIEDPVEKTMKIVEMSTLIEGMVEPEPRSAFDELCKVA